jgi:nitrogen fixation/metabolism regulation signal transduction histidine kinase
MWHSSLSWLSIVTFFPLLLLFWLFVALHIKNLLSRHFHSLANVIESLRLGDFSMRIAPKQHDSAWSEVYREVNALAQDKQQQKLQHVEADILLDKLLAEFDVPVLVFDRSDVLRNCNQKGCDLYGQSKGKLIGLNAQQLQLTALLSHKSGDVVDHWFPNQGGRWELRKNYFIQQGQRFSIVLVNDLSRTLREEERKAWTRLIRVLGHELNNSLASLISVSETLLSRLEDEKTPKWHASFEKALHLIHERSGSLLRFTDAYTRLAKLPPPEKKDVGLLSTFTRLTNLLEGQFEIENSSEVFIKADPDQLEQLLINLMKNAVEASSVSSNVKILWQHYQQGTRIRIIDSGPGLPTSDNLFVPFYTTKAKGNGIGLFLCRQIAEAHDGTLQLLNRHDTSGCIAECWLPMTPD